MISAVDCPDCGLQVPLRTTGPEGVVELPPNLYLESLLTVLQQDIACGVGDQRCSRCQTVGSASSCQHCRQVGVEHSVRSHSIGMMALSAYSCTPLSSADINIGIAEIRRKLKSLRVRQSVQCRILVPIRVCSRSKESHEKP